MKNTLKRTLSIILTLAMLLSTAVFSSAATMVESGKCGDNVTYELYDNGELIITGTGGIYSEAFRNKISVISVTIPASVTSIGENVFSDYPYIVIYGYKNSYAETYAKNNYMSFVALDGTDEESIVNKKLCKNVSWTLDKRTGVLELTGNGKMPNFDDMKDFGIFFGYHNHIKEIRFTGSFENFGNYLFKNLGRVKEINIPEGVTSIGDSAFENCENLTDINIPASVESMGDSVFSGCRSLTSIPHGITSIGNSAFSNCDGLTSVSIPEGITSIGDHAFSNCDGLTSVSIPEGVTSIGDSAFRHCSNLTTVTIPSSVTTIDNYAFYDCNKLKEVHINDLAAWCSIDFLPDYYNNYYSNPLWNGASLFINGEKAINLVVPDNVTHIKDYAFYGCKDLISVTLPSTMTNYNSDAIKSCPDLEQIIFALDEKNQSSISSIPYHAFTYTYIRKITLPASVSSISSDAFPNTIGTLIICNPDCEIADDCGVSYNVEVIGFKGSTAETFAENRGYYFTDIETVHTHEYKVCETKKEPSCIEPGIKIERCSCGKEKQVEITVLPHSPGEILTENKIVPTCTENGSYDEVIYCTVCNTELSRNTVTVPATGHTEEIMPAVAATCTATGLTEGKKCSVCGEILVAQETVPALGHAWDEGKVTTEPKCTKTGVKTFTCTRCGETYTEEIKATGHTEEIMPAVDATCTKTGLTEGKKCSVCGEILVAQETVPALGHTPGDTVKENEVKVTCTADGSYDEVIYCTVCNIELSRNIVTVPATGHTIEKIPAVAPTCTKDGLTEGEKCSVCGQVIKAQEVLPSTGHKWDEGKITKAPTLTEEGVKTYTCTVCGAEKTEAIPKLDFTPGDVDKDGSVTAADARHVLRASVGLEEKTSELIRIADIDKDGKITAADARLILRKSVGLE